MQFTSLEKNMLILTISAHMFSPPNLMEAIKWHEKWTSPEINPLGGLGTYWRAMALFVRLSGTKGVNNKVPVYLTSDLA